MELTHRLKKFIYLDINAQINQKKIEPYRMMVQTYFPNSRVFINRFRFRLWF